VPTDLLRHDCLVLQTPSFSSGEWRLEGPNGLETLPVSGSLQVNVADLVVTGIQNGMGIGMLPVYAAIEGLKNGSLTRVLPDYVVQRATIYAIYPSKKFVDAKIRTWVAFLHKTIPDFVDRDKALLNDSVNKSQIGHHHALGLRLITHRRSALHSHGE
jgi:DNA-binding transcriptional LysR family regulator